MAKRRVALCIALGITALAAQASASPRVVRPPDRFISQGVFHLTTTQRMWEHCKQVGGYTPQACTIGRQVVMPDPCPISRDTRETYAAAMCLYLMGRANAPVMTTASDKAYTMPGVGLISISCPCLYPRQYYASLLCHEGAGHALSRWKHETH